MSIPENIEKIKSQLTDSVTLCAISKTRTVNEIREAMHAGLFDFGENKVQEMVEKQAQLPCTIRWHQVGTLQRNKVKYIAPFVHLIHSVDSWKLLQEIDKEGQKNERVIPVLLQVHIALEETKHGLSREELFEILTHPDLPQLNHIQIKGLMGMATNSDDEDLVLREFKGLKMLFDELQDQFKPNNQIRFETLSMGMSGDFSLAVEAGSNLVRVGSAIFGERNYSN